MQKQQLIPIGGFSQMTRLSVKALRLYAENGLLPPAYVDPETGYRYYRPDQAHRARNIRTLRSVDMPLDEIGVILDSEDNQQTLQQLLTHKNRLYEKLNLQQRMLENLEKLINNEEEIMNYQIDIEQVEARQIAAVKTHSTLATIGENINKGFGTLMGGLGKTGAHPVGAPMVIYHNAIDKEESGDIEIAVPVSKELPSDEKVYGRKLEDGEMAVTLHKGPYDKISAAYHSITDWIYKNGYEISGPPREIYLNDPREVSPAELMTRLEFPVSQNQ